MILGSGLENKLGNLKVFFWFGVEMVGWVGGRGEGLVFDVRKCILDWTYLTSIRKSQKKPYSSRQQALEYLKWSLEQETM